MVLIDFPHSQKKHWASYIEASTIAWPLNGISIFSISSFGSKVKLKDYVPVWSAITQNTKGTEIATTSMQFRSFNTAVMGMWGEKNKLKNYCMKIFVVKVLE